MRYLFFSHDGFGLGHLRRNSLIAQALLRRDPAATATLVTGLPFHSPWLRSGRVTVVRVPPLLKDHGGAYRAPGIAFEQAIRRRAAIFAAAIASHTPDVLVVDRHPYGTAGELRPGLLGARRAGVRIVLGLRDVLDEPRVVRHELAGEGWAGMEEIYDEVLVYGARHVCDHEREYGLPMAPRYCGWVVRRPPAAGTERRLLAVAAGGGGDGGAVFELGIRCVERLTRWRGYLAAGPYADADAVRRLVHRSPARRRTTVDTGVDDCGPLFARADAVLQMAGYNSTAEALAAGHRPILAPRRAPRREQAIRADRLAALGVCDVVGEAADADEVLAIVGRQRRLAPGQLAAAGIRLDGAETAASVLEKRRVGAAR